jgi:hypothetical protein
VEIIKPVFRIFDYDKALAFYMDWLGFKIVWEYKHLNTPVYLEISLRHIVLHLSEHHGDATPGARVFIDDFKDLKTYHKELLDKTYKYNRPGLQVPFYDDTALEMTAIDPFANRLTFVERNAHK